MREAMNLGGEWVVYLDPDSNGPAFTQLKELSGSGLARAAVVVPCAVEEALRGLDMLPGDLFVGENVLAARAFERWRYYFTCCFDLPASYCDGETWDLVCEGVDTCATYNLNGLEIGKSSNMLVPVRIALEGAARPGANELVVRIDPPWGVPLETLELGPGSPEAYREESLYVRKAPHMYGWDVMPRLLSGGIWRPVRVEQRRGPVVEDWVVSTLALATDHSSARLRLVTLVSGLPGLLGGTLPGTADALTLELVARHGASEIKLSTPVRGARQELDVWIGQPELWWPRGYGEPACYKGTLRLLSGGEIADEVPVSFGVRTVALDGQLPGEDGATGFSLSVNGTPVFCVGPNWVPLDPDHSRDSDHYHDRISLLAESGANMVRCWGGNVYEAEGFFDAMDGLGVMVWQDIAMACASYPQDRHFASALEAELQLVVPRLRRHPSLVIWCGDNEGDQINAARGIDPDTNNLTRRVIPDVLARLDPFRPYWPSSPYISSEQFRRHEPEDSSDVHLWGRRPAFWDPYYTTYRSAFVSEIGFMGLPHMSTLREMFGSEEDCWWPPGGRKWLVHATDPTVDESSHYWERARKTFDRAEEYIRLPKELREAIPADVVFASQVVQAEGFKFAIEHARHAEDPEKSGLLWWNLADGWPQVSDAVVDYYGRRKLAYYFIKRVQTPLLLSLLEEQDGRLVLKGVNHSRAAVDGDCIVDRFDAAGRSERVWEGRLALCPGAHATLTRFALERERHDLYLIATESSVGRHANHAVVGEPPFDATDWRHWLTEILTPVEYEQLASFGF